MSHENVNLQSVDAMFAQVLAAIEQVKALQIEQGRIMQRNEERIGHVYETLTPLAPAISATAAKLDNHLADHRAEGKH
jgi:hypothetical protein